MEDLQVLIYIVFGIIYLIFNVLKKKQKGPEAGPPPLFEEEEREVGGTYRQEPGSLEELLERYDEAARRAKRRSAEKVETMREQVDDEFIPVAPMQSDVRKMEAETKEQLQRTEHLKSLQEELPAKARAQVFEKVRKEPKITVPIRELDSFEQKRFKASNKANKQAKLLQQVRAFTKSRQGMKQAVLLSEILNRKHF